MLRVSRTRELKSPPECVTEHPMGNCPIEVSFYETVSTLADILQTISPYPGLSSICSARERGEINLATIPVCCGYLASQLFPWE